jgi:hypothetical protein
LEAIPTTDTLTDLGDRSVSFLRIIARDLDEIQSPLTDSDFADAVSWLLPI